MAPRFIALALAASLTVVGADRGRAGDGERGLRLAAMCASCHRLDGRDRGIPSIVGITPEKLAGAMTAYKSGARSSGIMRIVAQSLSDADIATLAACLATRANEGNRRQ